MILLIFFYSIAGHRLILRHEGPSESDSRLQQRGEGGVPILIRGGQQQRYLRGGRPDPRHHLLHLKREELRPPVVAGHALQKTLRGEIAEPSVWYM